MDNKERQAEIFKGKAWTYKQGWLHYERDPWLCNNPHKRESLKYRQFEDGWIDARFHYAVEGGYHDWIAE